MMVHIVTLVGFYLLVVQVLPAAITSSCPANLARDGFLKARGNICYQFVLNRRYHYVTAKQACESHGGFLALAKSKDDNEYLVNTLNNQFHFRGRIWIGLQDIRSENKYVWEDGTSLHDSGYTNWAVSEGPASDAFRDKEDCVAVDTTDGGKWHDHECSSDFGDFDPFCEFGGVGDLGGVDLCSKMAYICQFGTGTVATTQAVTPTRTMITKTTIPYTHTTQTPPTSRPTAPPTTSSTTPSTPPTTTQSTRAPTTPTTTPTSTPTTTASTMTSTTTSTTFTWETPTCPPFHCEYDCGLDGYKEDKNGCTLCQCNGE